MTDEQIIQLAEQHFSFITEYTATGWIADTENLIKFAWEIYGIASDETLQDYESKF